MDIQNMVKQVMGKYKLQQHPIEWIQFLEYVEKLQPKVILEIGIASGASTLCLSHFTDCIIGVDCCVPKKQKVYKEIRRNCEFHFVQHDTNYQKCISAVEKFLDARQIDLLFIDGEHSYRGAKRDFNKFTKFLKPNGVVALHDIANSAYHRGMGCKVYRFWDELKNKYESTEISVTDWGGIGIIIYAHNRDTANGSHKQ